MRTELLDTFRLRYPFPLDPFQEQAIHYILEGDSVIVSAPTGAGKTLIAEFAIYQALSTGRRVAYTTPLKALSNQKFADFCKQFGEENVGILTGDVKVNPGAPLMVMTTEILRNKLYTRTLAKTAYVVLDECHYMGDEGRGTVWEEIIINCPWDIQLIALSATVGNIDEIAEWISEVHRPIRKVVLHWRPRPLALPSLWLRGRVDSGQWTFPGSTARGRRVLAGHGNGTHAGTGDPGASTMAGQAPGEAFGPASRPEGQTVAPGHLFHL